MTNRASIFKISDEELKKEIKGSKEEMFERYYECPVCGNEPFPGAVFIKGVKPILPVGYFCPKCFAITLTIAIRVKAEYLPLLESAATAGHLGSLQNRIEAQERRELSARQKMLQIIDPSRLYQKLMNTQARRGLKKGTG